MNFTCITNIPAFFRCVADCSGDVFFVDKDGVQRNLKQLALSAAGFEHLFSATVMHDLTVTAVTIEDRRKLMRHMMEMTRPA